MKLMKAMATVGGLTGVSRIAGFVRDILTASILGAGPVGDAFFVALKLPNFFRRVTAEGAFSVAFVPIYTETLERDGVEQAGLFASRAFTMMLLILGAMTLLALWGMPWVLYVVTPGFQSDPLRFDLAVELSRVTFPYLLMMSLAALLGAVLNAHDRFGPFAFAPTLFNLSLIVFLLCAGLFETPGHAMAWGVAAAGVLQLLFLMACLKRQGLNVGLVRPEFSPRIRRVFKLMGPGVIGAGVMHINLFADMMIASFLTAGSISYLYYADRLNQLPLGVVGIAVGTALLPMLSRAMAAGKGLEANHLFNRALEICLILALPAAAALAVIPHTLIAVLFERGAFTAQDTQVTAQVLACYALGLPAYIATKVFSTAHWARQDTVTPVKISVAATLANIFISLALIPFIGVVGIALGTGFAGWLQFAAHIRALRGYEAAAFDERFRRNWPRILMACGGMGLMLLAVDQGLAKFMMEEGLAKILFLAGLVVGGMAFYALSVLWLGIIDIKDMKRYLKRSDHKPSSQEDRA